MRERILNKISTILLWIEEVQMFKCMTDFLKQTWHKAFLGKGGSKLCNQGTISILKKIIANFIMMV